MVKGVKKIRRSIAHRNKMRSTDLKKSSDKQLIPMFPQEEEKHGYIPTFLDRPLETKPTKKRASGIMVKGILSIGLFFGVSMLLQTNIPLFSKPQEWTSHALENEFPFARVNQWYQTTFGFPLAFTSKEIEKTNEEAPLAMPVNGNIIESFQANGTGIMISPTNASTVAALHEGFVIFAGNDRQTNKTVIIQHADNSISTYGLLSSIDVHLYQFVGANQKIGVANPTGENKSVYFSIEKDNKYVDPIQVIEVDDIP